ncbi:nucleotide disphospho-sugar-binding domain-containing protein [Streptomyces sp. NPDC058200]|uniref:nucleotide disphospho-sugar-binding domain-containing protein n=1 Tax=Streptomyces sp. NPDC058200 TaxID=3346378 RepID=UPI0036EF8D90
MRVLMMVTPGAGHAYPMVPLAWALQSAGHEVLAASSGPGLLLGEAGVRCVDVAPGLSLAQMQGKLAQNHPEVIARLNDDALVPDYHQTIGIAVASALRLQPDMVSAMIRTAEEWQPDLVIYSPLFTPGLVAAAKLKVPAVRNEFGLVRTDSSPELMRELHSDLFEAHGVDLPEVRATIDVTPPSMGTIEPGSWLMGTVPFNGGGTLPDGVFEYLARSRRDVPRIAVTFGSGPAPAETVQVVRNIVAAARDMDAEFVLATPTVDLKQFGTLPDNVKSVGWAPLVSLMGVSSAVIHHGGPGSAFGAIMSGLPQVIPAFGGLGRPLIIEAVVDRGLGVTAPPQDIGRELLESVLADEAMKARAQAVREEILGLPTPGEIVGRLVDLVENSRGATATSSASASDDVLGQNAV